MKRRLLRLLGFVMLLGGGVPFVVRSIERSMTYFPTRYDPSQPWQLPPSSRELWFTADDGVRLHGWLLETERRPARGALLYFHGNAGNLTTFLPAVEQIRQRGFDVLIWDYRGFGRSDGAPQDEAALYRDGDAATRAFAQATGVPVENLILYGHSLGTTVATEMAIRHGSRALVLQAPLASIREQIAHSLPWMPRFVASMTASKFETEIKVAALRCPLLVIHGERDETIPIRQGLAVYAAAAPPKRLKLYPDGQHVLGETNGWAHIDEIVRFVEEMAP